MQSAETLRYYTKKKSTLYLERDETKRQYFLSELAKKSPEKVIFIDESGINKFLYREHAWSKRGEKVSGNIHGKRYVRESFIAGLKSKEVIAPLCYQGTCDTLLFNFWLVNFLLPELTPGHTIVMDNAAFHKSEETRSLIHKAGCELLFLPPYSPDLNPIEKVWANIKALIRKVVHQFSTIGEAIDYAFNWIN